MLLKTQVVLYLFDELSNGRKIYLQEVLSEFGMSIRTFRRYISEIQAYFTNFIKQKLIKYSMKEKTYYLTDASY